MSWPLVSIGSVAKVASGYAFKSKDFEEIGSPIVRISNVKNGSVDLTKVARIPEEKLNKGKRFQIESGSLLIAMSGATTGKVGRYVPIDDEPAYLNQRVGKFVCNEELLDLNYLWFFTQSSICQKQISFLAAGAAQPNISGSQIESIEIPLPPLETQKQIATVLEKADQLRKDCQQMELELNSLAQSVFIDMFGDQLTSPHDVLGNVSNVVSGVTKGQKHNNKVIVKVPYMRVANVQAGYLNLNEIKEIEVKESDVEKYKLEVGDVLLTEGGDHDKLGRGAIWNGEVDNCIHQNHVFRVRLDTELYTSQWFNGYLKTDFAKRYFLKCAKKTTNLASINITQLKGLPMPDIDIKEQVRFEKIITSINSQMLSNTELAHQYDENFNALMQKAFKGELNL
ncbi:restriction endonuclease subunit S [Photobacterium leiognathi]|uniref:restriction endonuclease subunit S n=1 Tax=Photobacterium leiognathi TaxID=553611 RepID=UPI0029811D0A|nr:restriction endonuclease subunit S [Photobacterium leiognathi]